MEKQGVSAIVATVLIVLLAVMGVTILFTFVIPTVQTNLDEATTERVELSIQTEGGYTVWDEDNKAVKIQIKRGNDNVDLEGINFNFFAGTDSLTETSTDFPTPGTVKTYTYSLGDFGKPDLVRIAAVVDGKVVPTSGNTEIGGSSNSGGDNDAKSGSVPDEDLENAPALDCTAGKTLYGASCYIPVNDCQSLNIEGESYLLNESINIDATCFTLDANEISFNLGGNTINGDGMGGYWGIIANGVNDTSIYGGTLDSMGGGIYLNKTEQTSIYEIISSNNQEVGIRLGPSIDSYITNSSFISNLVHGIHITSEASQISFKNILANSNFVGVYMTGTHSIGFVNFTTLVPSGGLGFVIEDSGSISIDNSSICGGSSQPVIQFTGVTGGCYGEDNLFDSSRIVGSCDGWPVENTHYVDC